MWPLVMALSSQGIFALLAPRGPAGLHRDSSFHVDVAYEQLRLAPAEPHAVHLSVASSATSFCKTDADCATEDCSRDGLIGFCADGSCFHSIPDTRCAAVLNGQSHSGSPNGTWCWGGHLESHCASLRSVYDRNFLFAIANWLVFCLLFIGLLGFAVLGGPAVNRISKVNRDFAPSTEVFGMMTAGESSPVVPCAAFEATASLPDVFLDVASAFSFRSALLDPTQQVSLTYIELALRMNLVAKYLLELRAGVGHRIAIATDWNVANVVALLGTIASGSVAFPIDLEWPQQRQIECLNFARVKAIVRDNSPMTLVFVHHTPMVFLDCASGRLLNGTESLSGPIERLCLPTSSPALASWSSGTTGSPKAVIYNHNSLVLGCNTFVNLCNMGQSTVSVAWPTIEWHLYACLSAGGETVLATSNRRFDAIYIAELTKVLKVTTLSVTPFLLDLLMEEFVISRPESLLQVASIGAPLPMACVRRFHRICPGARLHNLYGTNETGSCVWTSTSDPSPSSVNAPVGYPMSNVAVVLIDERGVVVTKENVKGEVCFGATLQEYWDHSSVSLKELEAKVFRHVEPYGRLYFTGDLGFWGPHGLEVLGRLDRQLLINGIRLEPGEVEAAALASSAGLQDAVCVLASNSTPSGLVLFVTPETVDTELVRVALLRAKPSYMVPSKIVALDAIPQLANGKVDFTALEDRAYDEHQSSHREIRDSVGVCMKASRDLLLTCRVVWCGYGIGIMSIILKNWLNCLPSGYCTRTTKVAFWLQYFVRFVLAADYGLYLFVVGGACLERLRSTHLFLGKRELVCLTVFFLMGWPLTNAMMVIEGVEKAFVSMHRWYLAMYLCARVIIVSCQHIAAPGTQVGLLGIAWMFSFSSFAPLRPTVSNCVAYVLGIVEARHGCMHVDAEEFTSFYDQKFVFFIFLYLACFHYANAVCHKGALFLRTHSSRLVCLVLLYLIMLKECPCFPATTFGGGTLASAALEAMFGVSISGLVLACFVHWQPSALLWMGQHAFAAYVSHSYMHAFAVRGQVYVKWDPDNVFATIAGLSTSHIITGLLQLMAVFCYVFAAVGISAAMSFWLQHCTLLFPSAKAYFRRYST